MLPTIARRAQYGTEGHGATSGLHPFSPRQNYKTFKSAYGPSYKIGTHIAGLNIPRITYYSTLAAGFGGVAGFFALFFFTGVPRVQKDILQKVPILGDYFKHEIAPEDNPF